MNRRARRAAAASGGLGKKLGQILEVGGQLSGVGAKIDEVNQQLVHLDQLILNVNEARNVASQALQEMQGLAVEQQRQRYATLHVLAKTSGLSVDEILKLDEAARADFDKMLADKVVPV